MLNFGIQRLFLLIEEWAIIDLKQPISPDTSSQMTWKGDQIEAISSLYLLV